MDNKKRVVVTGIGALTSLGFDETTIWENMLAGKTGIKQISSFDVTEHKGKNGAEIDSEELRTKMKEKKVLPLDRTISLSMLASAQALEQANLINPEPPYEPNKVATIIGTHGTFETMCNAFESYTEKGLAGVRPSTLPRCIANATASFVSIKFRLTGPNFVVASACSASTTAIGTAYRMVKDGYIDKALCGGSEAIFHPFIYAGWNALGVISKIEDPEECCRPFAADREGCVLGEGAGSLVIETLESALERGAHIRAEIVGYGESSDAEHITKPSTEGQVRAITNALDSADIKPEDVGFINAHGTATISNDECEANSIRTVFGDAADNIPVASNKSFFGHLLGASGAMETIVTILGLENGKVPPNMNLENPDPKCDINLVGNEPQAIDSPIAVKNSFGFGGDNAVLVLKRWDG